MAYIQGVSTRSVDVLVQAMEMTGISKSRVSRLCSKEIDCRARRPSCCPLEGDWTDVWLDANNVEYRREAGAASPRPSPLRSASTATDVCEVLGIPTSAAQRPRASGPSS